jgi:hypothetical protein
VRRAESAVRADPGAAFEFDPSGLATLTVDDDSWCAGRFGTPSIRELRERLSAGGGEARLWVFDGRSPVTDIGALHATAGGRPLFQVASQFNCLEAPSPRITSVANYFSDSTQGPRASISAFPATLQRHYAAPDRDGGRSVQETDRGQIDLLADVFAPGRSPVRNGYLVDDGGLGGRELVSALEQRFEHIRLGIHEAAAVVLGHNWYGKVPDPDRRIAQCFTSTVAGGFNGGERALGASFAPACRQLLRGAYLGTLLAAISLDRSPVVLTLIGGGAFGNPFALIWESITWAFDEVRSQAGAMLDVIVNIYDGLDQEQDHRERKRELILAGVRERDGAVLRFDINGLSPGNR